MKMISDLHNRLETESAICMKIPSITFQWWLILFNGTSAFRCSTHHGSIFPVKVSLSIKYLAGGVNKKANTLALDLAWGHPCCNSFQLLHLITVIKTSKQNH